MFELQRRGPDQPWKLVTDGAVNPHVSENSPTTFPWGFEVKHFQEATTTEEDGSAATSRPGEYFGSSEGIGLDYFVGREAS